MGIENIHVTLNEKNFVKDIETGFICTGHNWRGADQYVNASNDVARFGKMGAVEINDVLYKQAVGEKGFTQFNPVANQASRVSWLVQLGVTSNDDLAKIAVANLDKEPEVAIKAMKDYLGSLSEKELGRFQLYEAGGNIDIHARKAYDAVRNLYSKRNGEVNLDLLKKVRTFDEFGNPVVSTKNLSLEDLPNSSKLSPEFISGPTLVPVFESNNFAAWSCAVRFLTKVLSASRCTGVMMSHVMQWCSMSAIACSRTGLGSALAKTCVFSVWRGL